MDSCFLKVHMLAKLHFSHVFFSLPSILNSIFNSGTYAKKWRRQTDLECASDAVNAVVGFLGWKPSKRQLDGVILFWDQVIGSIRKALKLCVSRNFIRRNLSKIKQLASQSFLPENPTSPDSEYRILCYPADALHELRLEI